MLISFGFTLMVSSNGCSFPIIYMGVRYLIVEYDPVISFVQSVYMAFVIQCSIVGHISLIPSQSVFALSLYCCVSSGEATDTNFIVFGSRDRISNPRPTTPLVEYDPVISFVQSVYMAFVIQCSIDILVIDLLVILVERTL
jgi:hypothetical protein